MIVRNEERFLAACLDSIKTLVDEIVVVDTGSTDRTVRIARQFGARVFHAKWPGSFAAARNVSLAHVTAQWVLYIDADERVRRPFDRRRLRRLLRHPRIAAMTVDLHPTARTTALRTFRMFRRDPRVRFEGAMHETMMRGVEQVVREDGAVLRHSGLIIDHEGYEDQDRRKARRNLPILRRALAAEPQKIWNRAHLALVYVALGRPRDAVRTWQRGIADVKRTGSRDPLDSVAHAGYASWLVANRQPAGRVLMDGIRRFPGNLELHWIRARWLMSERRWREAIPILTALTKQPHRRQRERRLPYPEGIFGADAYEALGTCYFKLRDYKTAAAWYRRAHRAAPERLEYRVKAELAKQSARRKVITT